MWSLVVAGRVYTDTQWRKPKGPKEQKRKSGDYIIHVRPQFALWLSLFFAAQMVQWAAVFCLIAAVDNRVVKRSYSDHSIRGYLTEVSDRISLAKVCHSDTHWGFFFFRCCGFQRVCWWNEVCKEEFQLLFRCKCPVHSYCRSPGRYYNAYCSITNTGYIWNQPSWDWVP